MRAVITDINGVLYIPRVKAPGKFHGQDREITCPECTHTWKAGTQKDGVDVKIVFTCENCGCEFELEEMK